MEKLLVTGEANLIFEPFHKWRNRLSINWQQLRKVATPESFVFKGHICLVRFLVKCEFLSYTNVILSLNIRSRYLACNTIFRQSNCSRYFVQYNQTNILSIDTNIVKMQNVYLM